MKNKLLFALIALISFCCQAQESEDRQKWIAENDIQSIEDYCRQELFFIYGTNAYHGNFSDCWVASMSNEKAEKVLPLLRHGAKLGNPNCQFMLACVLSCYKTVRTCDENEKRVEIPIPADYKYLNDAEAKLYFKRYLSNPKMDKESGPFGYDYASVKLLISNAYPALVK